MTIQPFKNDQGVMPMVSDTKTFTPVNEAVHPTEPTQNSVLARANTFEQGQGSVILSGATTSPGKEAASQLAGIRGDVAERTQKTTLIQAALKVESQLADMQQVMQYITKNFPPFSPDDAKRQQYLMSITSIREQIQAMTLPPPPPAIPASGMWKDFFKGTTIPSLPATGPGTASDAQVHSAYEDVVAARAILAQRRETLVRQTIPAVSLAPAVASQTSMQMGQQLSATGATLSVNLVGELQNFMNF
jgi:hypothetical protein